MWALGVVVALGSIYVVVEFFSEAERPLCPTTWETAGAVAALGLTVTADLAVITGLSLGRRGYWVVWLGVPLQLAAVVVWLWAWGDDLPYCPAAP